MFQTPFARIGLALMALVAPLPATAQNTPATGLRLELNNAQDGPDGMCELTILTENATANTLERAAWQFAIFDADGRVRALPVIDFGTLIQGKTRLVVIAMPGRPCAQISRIVVNDVAECRIGGENQPDLCLTGLATSSLVDIDFGL